MMSNKSNLKNSQKFSVSSSKKIEICSKRSFKPLYGVKINTKEYESFQNLSRNIFKGEKNRLNQTSGYSNPLSMAKLRDYTTNDSTYNKDLANFDISNYNPENVFKKKSETDVLLSPNNEPQKKPYTIAQRNFIKKNPSMGFSNDKNLKQLQKYVLNHSGFENKNDFKNNSSTVKLNNNITQDEGFISQRIIMQVPQKDVNQFKSHRHNNNIKFNHRRSKTGNVEELVDYIYEMSQNKKQSGKELIVDNVDEFIKKNKISPQKSLKNSKFFLKSPLVKNQNKISGTPKNFKYSNKKISIGFEKEKSQIIKDLINQSNPNRKQSLNIYKNNLNKSEKINAKYKYSLNSQSEQNSKIRVFDKDGKSYLVDRNLLESGKKSNKSSKKNFLKKVELTNTQKQEELANQIINNNMNLRERNFEYPNIEGEINTTDLDSYAKEISDHEDNIKILKDSLNIDSSNFKKENDNKKAFNINEEALLSDSENKLPTTTDHNKSSQRKFEISDPNSQQVVISKSKTGKVKVFNLCFDDVSEEENRNEPRKVNVSKKDDSGTDFFVVNGKKSFREIKKPKKVFEICPEQIEENYLSDKQDLQFYKHSVQNKKSDLNSSFESNNSSFKFSHMRKKELNDSSYKRNKSNRSIQNEDVNLLYKRNPLENSYEQSERNLYQKLQSSMAPPIKNNNNLNASNLRVEKFHLGQNNLHSARMIEDLKKFGKNNPIEQFKKNSISSQKKKKLSQKKQVYNNNIVDNNVVSKRRKGHKRNVHSEQYTDIIKQVVKKHDIPVQLGINNANMTPDLSRNNSLNVSDDEDKNIKEPSKLIYQFPNNDSSKVYKLSSFENLEDSKTIKEKSKPQMENSTKSKRKIDFLNVEDESDIIHIKEPHSNPLNLKEFEERNKKDIKKFEQNNKIQSRGCSSYSEQQPKAPLPTKEISHNTMAKESSKNSYVNCSKNKDSRNASSKKNLSFGQISGRGSKISITIMTHKSSKNSDFNNNIVISHSLQNSGIHNNSIKQNVFKLESPDPGSGLQSPQEGITIQVQEENKDFDRMPTINPKNLTFNPNSQKVFEIEEENCNEIILENDIKDLQIPQMGSSYEDSMISYHSNDSNNETKNLNEITENTFGKGMNVVIKEAKSKNIFDESINASSHIDKQSNKKEQNLQQQNKNYKKIGEVASVSNPVTEFYYEREHIGNGDSSYKLSVSDNSSNLKNVTRSNSNNQGPSSKNESPDIVKPKIYSKIKVKQEILRGKLNSPIKTRENNYHKKVFNLEKIPSKQVKDDRNDNIMKIKDVNFEKSTENMTHSELVEFRNKNARKKFTQIYDNKSAMLMLENNKNKSANVSPSNRKRKKYPQVKETSIDKEETSKKKVAIIKSKRSIKRPVKTKHLDFVNMTNESSTIENKEKIKKKNYSRKTSRNNSIDERIKKSTVEKKKSQIKSKKKIISNDKESSKKKNLIKKKKEKKLTPKLKISKNKQILEIKIMKHISKGENIETNLEFYDLKKLLGEGSYAKVHLGLSVLCSKKVAIKLYDKSKIKSKTSSERIFTEIDILRRMNHRNIVNLIEIFQNKRYIFIVLEYANGGDLLNYLKNYGRFKENEFRNILQQIIDGLEYIHDHKYLHRDIKLDNILLTKSGLVKICDFGISRKMNKNDKVFEHIGTPAYIAPEIIKENGYSGFGADIWSLGVTTFMALTGNVPFKGSSIEELHESILKNDIKFPEKVKLSEEMKRAIRGMLIKDPEKRISLKEVCSILDLRRVLGRRNDLNYADETVIQEIKSFGYPEKVIKESLQKDVINHITALYKLMKN